GFTGVDFVKTPAVSIAHDLNVFPYPFASDSVEEIIMDNVLEHIDDIIKVMEEIYRISRAEAIIKINVPYFKSNSAYTDPTHKHFFSETSFKYFTKENSLNFYTGARFEIIQTKLIRHTQYKDAKHFFRNLLPFKKLLNYFLFNIYDEIYFELKCLK
ncbi:MAG: class I SAM-dependent methyltransferase, partial [Patescibacteria group bacterium]